MTSPYFSSISLTSTSPQSPSLLEPVYRRFQSSLSCDNAVYGCHKRFYTLDDRREHKSQCEYTPTSTIECPDCHKEVQRSLLRRHNCIKELSSTISELKAIVVSLEAKVNQQTIHLDECRQILEASPYLITTDEVDTTPSDAHSVQSIHPIAEVFESEPEVTHFSDKLKSQEPLESIPELYKSEPSYRRSDVSKQISKDLDYRMYGSPRHRFLAQLSRELSELPPIDYDLDITLERDLKKKNKKELIDVSKDSVDSNGKPPLVRVRSWSERDK